MGDALTSRKCTSTISSKMFITFSIFSCIILGVLVCLALACHNWWTHLCACVRSVCLFVLRWFLYCALGGKYEFLNTVLCKKVLPFYLAYFYIQYIVLAVQLVSCVNVMWCVVFFIRRWRLYGEFCLILCSSVHVCKFARKSKRLVKLAASLQILVCCSYVMWRSATRARALIM